MKETNISVVVPVLNEQEVLKEFYTRLSSTLNKIDNNYEIIFIDDGSTDNSLRILEDLNGKHSNVKIVSFSRNFGHQIAISAGLEYSKGKATIVMDADLQDPPEVIVKLSEKWKEGYKVVYGIRKWRKEGFFKRLCYKFFYRLLRIISKTDIPLDAGDFCLMDRKIVDLLNSLPERARFVRGLRSWVGFPQIGIEYERDRRYSGKAKYTFPKLVGLAVDGLISFSEFPLRIAIVVGFIISFFSIVYAAYLVILRLLGKYAFLGWATLVVGIMFFGGIQLIALGILGGYIAKIFDEVKERPLYIVDKKIGFSE